MINPSSETTFSKTLILLSRILRMPLVGVYLSWTVILRNGHCVSGEITGDPSPGMTLGAVFHQPSVIWSRLTSVSLLTGTSGEGVWRLSGVHIQAPALDKLLRCQRRKLICCSFRTAPSLLSSFVVVACIGVNYRIISFFEYGCGWELKFKSLVKITWFHF